VTRIILLKAKKSPQNEIMLYNTFIKLLLRRNIMGMTMTQKILAEAAGLKHVQAGQLVECNLDLVQGNDITAPVAIEEFEKVGFEKVHDNNKISLVLDHYTPCKDIQSAKLCVTVRNFAKKHNIKHFYDVGQAGIEHVLAPEKGLCAPGEVIIGADSHTCTYGAVGAFSTGVGSTDMAAGMATGKNWFKIPAAIKVVLEGNLRPFVSGKDVILHLIGLIGVDGARYKSLEFTGPGAFELEMDDRFTICNMAIEAGAKNGIFPVDDKCLSYVNKRVSRPYRIFEADDDAVYDSVVTINLSKLEPTVALPHLPSNTKTVSEVAGMEIQQVVIGSCTNGRIKDMREAASIMKGRKVADGIRCIIIPGSQEVYLQCIKEGLAEIFIEAGAAISTPTCGPCLGGHMGILAPKERAVSTTNRNFVGRMGDAASEVVLSNPAVAAASAIAGCVADPETI
jgi:3-isopropylmalate/(R)-2-methylmalate dehydratase large subunit